MMACSTASDLGAGYLWTSIICVERYSSYRYHIKGILQLEEDTMIERLRVKVGYLDLIPVHKLEFLCVTSAIIMAQSNRTGIRSPCNIERPDGRCERALACGARCCCT